MNRWTFGGILALVLVVGISIYAARGDGDVASKPGVQAKPAVAPKSPDIVPAPGGESGSAASVPNALNPPNDTSIPPDHHAIKNYTNYISFQERTRSFFDGAAKSSLDERKRGGAAIAGEISVQEKEGKLLPVESLFLNLAILEYTTANDDEYKGIADQMVGEFRARAARAESEQVTKALADPRFVSYKEREAAIAQEALTMPEGPARDEFLRKRLEEARIEAYRPAPVPR